MMVKTSEKQTKKDAVMMLGDAADLSTSTWRARNFKLSCDFEKNIPYSLPLTRDAIHDERWRDDGWHDAVAA
jgi:hypothetical protein